jgi:hypothetical protein
MQSIHRQQDADHFQEVLNGCLEDGGEIISSGMQMHGVIPAAWAFVQLPEEPEGPVAPDEPEKPEEPLRWLDGEICKRIASTTLEPTLDEVRYKIWMEALDLVREARRRAKAGI